MTEGEGPVTQPSRLSVCGLGLSSNLSVRWGSSKRYKHRTTMAEKRGTIGALFLYVISKPIK